MTAQSRTLQEIAHDALEDLEVAKRHLGQLESLLYAAGADKGISTHIRNLIDIGWSLACDGANLASCSCEEIGLALGNCATQNAEFENVSRTAGVGQ